MKKKKKKTAWALYVRTARYSVQGIDLYRTERAAWEALARYLSIGWKKPIPTDGPPEDLVKRCTRRAEHEETDFCIQRVEIP